MPFHKRYDSSDDEPMTPLSLSSRASEIGSVRSRRSRAAPVENIPLARAEVKTDDEIGVIPAARFNAALWAYTARMTAYKASAASNCNLKGDAGPARAMGKHIKMLSLNPSVYGNVYGVLGSS